MLDDVIKTIVIYLFEAIFLNFFLFKFNYFFDNNPDRTVLQSSINSARNKITTNINWHIRNFEGIRKWYFNRAISGR